MTAVARLRCVNCSQWLPQSRVRLCEDCAGWEPDPEQEEQLAEAVWEPPPRWRSEQL